MANNVAGDLIKCALIFWKEPQLFTVSKLEVELSWPLWFVNMCPLWTLNIK